MLRKYIKNKWRDLLITVSCVCIASTVLLLSGTGLSSLILTALLVFFIYGCFFTCTYLRYKKEQLHIERLIRELDHLYLVHELLGEPEAIEAKGYYELMKLSNRDMCNKIAENTQQLREYREFIEEWIHELKTPLTSLELLGGAYSDSDTGVRDSAYELERMKSILDRCLNYIRMDTLEKDYHVEVINAEQFIHELIMEERVSIREKKMKVIVDIAKDCSISSDKKWVQFIFKQLLNNAVKYSSEGGSLIFICTVTESITWLGLKDCGCGISASELPRIYEKGFTGSSTGRDTASGIGLYLVKKCADRMNLKLRVTSELGLGSLFEVGFGRL